MIVVTFDPPLERSDFKMVLPKVQAMFPDWTWCGRTGTPEIRERRDILTGALHNQHIMRIGCLLYDKYFQQEDDCLMYSGAWIPEDKAYYEKKGKKVEVIDGWSLMVHKPLDTEDVFTFLSESIDEFDWVDPNINLSGQKLFDAVQELFTQGNSRYWIEGGHNEMISDTYQIWDETGIYVEFNPDDFTVSRLKEDLLVTIGDTDMNYEIREEYFELAKTLEPIIGSIGKDIFSINESTEFDWVKDLSNYDINGWYVTKPARKWNAPKIFGTLYRITIEDNHDVEVVSWPIDFYLGNAYLNTPKEDLFNAVIGDYLETAKHEMDHAISRINAAEKSGWTLDDIKDNHQGPYYWRGEDVVEYLKEGYFIKLS